ncbi:unnamed protein product [Rotaria socialis]|uniref:C2 domain-containing protein n=1 Tax=Rotaria socialis TaxID=392032 RepID=A0A821XUI6_9BILA|nr:unnamed protein product [Rotaria socialis]CAF4950488.1 unnamed protein product [Rotaria socialis]
MPHGTLEVVIAEGRRINDQDAVGKNYVEVYLDKNYKLRTTTTSNINNPVWNERFTFDIRGSDGSIHFEIYDDDVEHKDPIGKCKVKVKYVIDNGHYDKWVKLTHMSELSPDGEIHIIMKFEPSSSTRSEKESSSYLPLISACCAANCLPTAR